MAAADEDRATEIDWLEAQISKQQLIQACLRVVMSEMRTEEHANSDAEAEYADEQLALAARKYALAVDKLPADRLPVGWNSGK